VCVEGNRPRGRPQVLVEGSRFSGEAARCFVKYLPAQVAIRGLRLVSPETSSDPGIYLSDSDEPPLLCGSRLPLSHESREMGIGFCSRATSPAPEGNVHS
jgi:hypothetical protein